ncbi:MAG TPA: thioredoxin-disulfide reductase [Chloroflexota bacterium]|nr:thioredoxin-disulfide reductase [Chloroflexota bacterium]
MNEELIDVVIVGGGPAGLTAGLYAARANLRAVLLEKLLPGGELLNTDLIEDYPGFVSTTGRELAEKMEEHARTFGLQIEQGTVQRITRGNDIFTTTTEEGPSYRSRTVIMAAGGVPKKLEVPGEELLAGRGVSYCAVCDGPLFRNKVVAVVGGGDSAFQEGIYLTRHASKVYLIHRRDEFRAQPILQEKARENEKIEFITSAVVDEIGGTQTVEWATIRNLKDGSQRRLPLDGVFVFIGFSPNSGLFEDHLDHDEQGFLITNERMETRVPGLYAAGDVRSQLARQITTAVGDATTAAIAAEHYIEDQVFRAERVRV